MRVNKDLMRMFRASSLGFNPYYRQNKAKARNSAYILAICLGLAILGLGLAILGGL